MAQSVVDACNSALQKCGAGRIMSLNDNTREARTCAVAYDSNRRSELRKHYWNFAMRRAVLAPSTTAPSFEYQYAFPLPADCLRIQLPKDATIDWKKEGNNILTNLMVSPLFDGQTQLAQSATGPALALRYVADITDVTQWDSVFYDVFAISLAIDIVEDLTQSNQKKQILLAEYDAAIAEAKLVDAFESLPADSADDPWWLARY